MQVGLYLERLKRMGGRLSPRGFCDDVFGIQLCCAKCSQIPSNDPVTCVMCTPRVKFTRGLRGWSRSPISFCVTGGFVGLCELSGVGCEPLKEEGKLLNDRQAGGLQGRPSAASVVGLGEAQSDLPASFLWRRKVAPSRTAGLLAAPWHMPSRDPVASIFRKMPFVWVVCLPLPPPLSPFNFPPCFVLPGVVRSF